jgi:DNA-binding NtrC family response regulator
MAKILVVDDETRIRSILGLMLKSQGHEIDEASDGNQALEKLTRNGFDLVISDMKMEGMGGKELLRSIKEKEMGCPVIFITAYASLESSIEALHLGAADYIVKPFAEEQIHVAVERALGVGRIITENIRLTKSIREGEKEFEGIFASPEMKRLKSMSLRVAVTDATVLITGESGVGKEVISRLIHKNSSRDKKRFVPVNCAAISQGLVESELFGHEKGAFTGADKRSEGKFEFANKGSLFLDEVGDLPHEAQAKLLRVIQEQKFQRVGGNKEIQVDTRLICATNQNLEQLVAKGKFREDLFYRLNVFPLEIPPLRDRIEDIIPLSIFFLKKHAKISGFADNEMFTPAGASIIRAFPWPGNVRELANAMERVMILKAGLLPVNADDLSFLISSKSAAIQAGEAFILPAAGLDYDKMQRSLVRQALERTHGNKSSAAKVLGLTRAKFRTLVQMFEKEGEHGA